MSDIATFDGPWGSFPLGFMTRALVELGKYLPLGRRTVRRRVLDSLTNTGPCDIAVRGLSYRVHIGDNAAERKLLLSGRRKDRAQLAQVLGALRDGATFVDIGANFGLYTLPAARRVAERGRVLAIEPNPLMADRLRFNLTSNRLGNVTICESAVGAEDGTAMLTADPFQFGKASLARISGPERIEVSVRTLLGLVRDVGLHRIDALKIDIEGFEDRALLPFFAEAPKTLWPAMILIETSARQHWKGDCIAVLARCGYRATWQGRDDTAFILAAG